MKIEVNKIITTNICKNYREGLVKETHITEEGDYSMRQKLIN